ncbi:MAG: T9SS type A sorting domain-containing protein, partial [Flavobacteriales bacterium]
VDPVFVSTTDLHALSPLHNDLGDNTVGILDDIDGEARPAGVNVDMGADEYTPLDFNAAFEAFVEPTSGSCGAVLTEVKVAILSLGAIPITSMPINVNVTGDATATLPFTYTGSLAFNQRDTVTIGTFDSYFGLNYNLDGYVALAGDQDTSDDSLSTSVTIIPFEPRGIDGYACDGADTAVIGALPLSGTAYFWYDAATGGTLVGSGDTYLIPSVSTQATYYAEYANNSGSLQSSYAGGNGSGGNMFDIVSLTGVTIQSFDGHLNSGTHATVDVYYKTGSHVGFETNPAAWTLIGTATNVVSAGPGVGTPIPLPININIPAGQTYSFYIDCSSGVDYTNGTAVGNILAANTELQILEGVGKSNNFGSTNTPRTFNGEVYYGTTACSSIRTPVTVTLSTSSVGAFTFTQTGLTVDFDATTTTDADSVLWNFDDGNTSTSITPTNTYAANGTYNVCLYAYSNCGIDTTCQTVDITVGVEELNNAGTAKVFPNPSRGQFVLDLTNYNDNDVTVVVFNQLGKVVYNKSISNNAQGEQHAIDLSAYSNGIYFLKLTSDKEVTTKKIVIQK